MVASPEGAGLITQRHSSGRNITGVSHVVPIEQQISAIYAYKPFQSMAVLFNPAEPNAVQSVAQLRQSAQRSRFTLIEQAIPLDDRQNPIATALPELVRKIANQRPQVLYLGADSFIASQRQVVTEAALAHRLPVFSATEVLLRDGKALFGLVSDYASVGRMTAFKAEQILMRGTRPQDIAIETLPQFSYIVNMSVAEQLDYYPSLKVINFAEIIR
jgi:putative ABC transport system substrate-binding protein